MFNLSKKNFNLIIGRLVIIKKCIRNFKELFFTKKYLVIIIKGIKAQKVTINSTVILGEEGTHKISNTLQAFEKIKKINFSFNIMIFL